MTGRSRARARPVAAAAAARSGADLVVVDRRVAVLVEVVEEPARVGRVEAEARLLEALGELVIVERLGAVVVDDAELALQPDDAARAAPRELGAEALEHVVDVLVAGLLGARDVVAERAAAAAAAALARPHLAHHVEEGRVVEERARVLVVRLQRLLVDRAAAHHAELVERREEVGAHVRLRLEARDHVRVAVRREHRAEVRDRDRARGVAVGEREDAPHLRAPGRARATRRGRRAARAREMMWRADGAREREKARAAARASARRCALGSDASAFMNST